MSELWRACAADLAFSRLQATLFRVVESQEQVATNSLVDNLQEQGLLEEMLEQTKPRLRPGTEKLHYLLATPFRYPPLRHGSRFGAHHEPGLFYGALERRTAFAETAYYRLIFWHGMSQPPHDKLTTQHTLFSASCDTARGYRLEQPPCAAHEQQLRDPADYSLTQSLGSAMREAGADAFTYVSARDRRRGVNIALFEPKALSCNKPLLQQHWLCETCAGSVSFSGPPSVSGGRRFYAFPAEEFMTQGKLPAPAV